MRKTFNRFTTTDGCIWNITHHTESTAVWKLKPRPWGSPLVQLNTREKRPVTRDNNNNNKNIIKIIIRLIIIIIIIIINSSSRPKYKSGVGQPLLTAACSAPAVLLDRWNNTSEVMYWENQVFRCNCVCHKFHVHYPGLELIPSQRETWAL